MGSSFSVPSLPGVGVGKEEGVGVGTCNVEGTEVGVGLGEGAVVGAEVGAGVGVAISTVGIGPGGIAMAAIVASVRASTVASMFGVGPGVGVADTAQPNRIAAATGYETIRPILAKLFVSI